MKSCPPGVRMTLLVLVFTVASVSAREPEVDGKRRAGQTLSGTIQLPSDMTNHPSSIQVIISGGNFHKMTRTGPGGNFMFTDVPNGDFVVEVRCPGYDTTRTELRDWSGMSEVNVPLGKAVTDGADALPPGAPTVNIRTLKVPEKAMKLAARAQEESDKQHLDKAVEWLQKALKICPDFVEAWNNLGVTYVRMGKTNGAETAFLKALQVDSAAVPALRNLGFLYLQTARPNEALSVLAKAREARGQKDLYIETYLGHALYATGRYQEAESILKQAIQMKSDFPPALYPLALAQVKLREYEEARQTLTRFLKTSDKGREADVARSVLARLDEMLGEQERKSAE